MVATGGGGDRHVGNETSPQCAGANQPMTPSRWAPERLARGLKALTKSGLKDVLLEAGRNLDTARNLWASREGPVLLATCQIFDFTR